jgi:hypothetical protein
MSMVPKNDLIRGSERYLKLANEIVSSSQIFEQKFTTIKNKIERTLKHPSLTIRHLDGKSNWVDFYSLKTRFPIKYKNSSTWGHIAFRTTGELTFLKGIQKKIEVTITGTIRRPGHNPSYSATDIYIQDEDANLHEPFRGREQLSWNGLSFTTRDGRKLLGI